MCKTRRMFKYNMRIEKNTAHHQNGRQSIKDKNISLGRIKECTYIIIYMDV